MCVPQRLLLSTAARALRSLTECGQTVKRAASGLPCDRGRRRGGFDGRSVSITEIGESGAGPRRQGGQSGRTLELRTACGAKVIAPRADLAVASFAMPACAHPSRLEPLLRAAECVAATLPGTTARKMAGAVRLWWQALTWFGVQASDVNEGVVVALMVLRCCPPVGLEVPPFAARPVLPTTAAADIDILRRAAREGLCDMRCFLPVLAHERVLRLQRSIGGRATRLRTPKRPFLFSALRTCLSEARARPTAEAVREAFCLCLGFFFGMRPSELLSLQGQDVNLSDAGDMVVVTLRSVKTRRSIFTSHEPYVVAGRAPLLVEWYQRFERTIGLSDDIPVFHKWKGAGRLYVAVIPPAADTADARWTLSAMSRDWLAAAVKRWAPGCVPHSLRVGCATEAWAAGVPLAQIQALGRWHSSAALLYVVGSLDQTAAATERLGSAGLRYTRDGLRVQVGTSAAVEAAWWPGLDDVGASWAQATAAADDDGASSVSSTSSG